MAPRWTVSVYLCAALTASAASPRLANARCHASCERVLVERAQRGSCNACLTSDAPAAWVFKRTAVPDAALADPDWAVRWAALQLRTGGAPAAHKALLDRLARAPAEANVHCVTLAYALAAGSGTAPWPATCAAPVRAALEEDLLSTEAWRRADALNAAPRALQVPVGRFVLDAVRRRHATAVGIAWAALVAHHDQAGPTPAALVASQAGAEDVAAMNALLALASAEVDRQRAALESPERARRREALVALTPFAPWTRASIEPLVLSPAAAEAKLAALALARGEGQSLGEYAKAVVSAPATPPATRSAWLAILGNSGAAGCDGVLRELAADRARPDDVRRQALAALGACARAGALPLIEAVAAEPSVAMRAAAVAAAGNVPRNARATALVDQAIDDADPTVQRAAVLAANAAGLSPTRYAGLTRHADDGVRADALGALLQARPAEATPLVCACVERDPSADVRLACAQHLGTGVALGLQPRATLARAAEQDPEPRVKMAAAAALRRLPGAVPPPSEPRPP